jgi:CHAT domain-containing protein
MQIAKGWNLASSPVVMLAACNSAVDTSGSLAVDEFCGLDLAFRIGGARASIASLWPVDDATAALSVTAFQRYFRQGRWKEFLLREEQLNAAPKGIRQALTDMQEPLWNLPSEAFASEQCRAAFRCHGR